MHWINWIAFGIAVVITGISGLAMLYQMYNGLNSTGLNDRYVWGLSIQGFFTLSSFGAGVLSIIAAWTLIGLPDAWFIFEPAATLAFGILIGAQILLGSDLGRPLRAFYIIKGRNFMSPLTWDFITLLILSISSFLFMFNILPQGGVLIKIWALITLLASFLCIVAHGLIFLAKVEAGYNSQPFDSFNAFVWSFWSGTAVFVILSLGTEFYREFSGLLMVCSLLAFAGAAGAFISAKIGGMKHKSIKSLVMSGGITISLIGNSLLNIEQTYLGPILSILVLIIVFIEKYDSVLSNQSKPILPLPYSKFDRVSDYRPSIFEYASLSASLGLSIVIFYGVTIIKSYILPFIISFI